MIRENIDNDEVENAIRLSKVDAKIKNVIIDTPKKKISQKYCQANYIEAKKYYDVWSRSSRNRKNLFSCGRCSRAYEQRKSRKNYITRPAEAGEQLGLLPGDLKEKIDPYLRPLYDALEDCMYKDKLPN